MGIHAYNTYNIHMYTLWTCALNLHNHHTAGCIACTYYILYIYIYIYLQYLLYYNGWCYINAEHGVPSGDHKLDIHLQPILINLPRFVLERCGIYVD